MSGIRGRLSCPTADTTTSNNSSPAVVRTRHLPSDSSKDAAVTSVFNRIRGRRPYLSAHVSR
jgi:hypothetical protein